MPSKIAIGIAVAAFAMLIGGRAGKSAGDLGWTASAAWAQEADEPAASVAPAEESVISEEPPVAPNEPGAKPTPISASGVYSGTVMDSIHGAGTISAAISQIRGKITGTWQDTFVPPAFINGTISPKGKISMRMRFFIKGNCGYLFKGVFQHGDEISGTYKLNGCKGMKPEHGSLDMTRQ